MAPTRNEIRAAVEHCRRWNLTSRDAFQVATNLIGTARREPADVVRASFCHAARTWVRAGRILRTQEN